MYNAYYETVTQEDRETLRKQIAKDVKEFLKKGGKITKIPIGVTAESRFSYNNRTRKVIK